MTLARSSMCCKDIAFMHRQLKLIYSVLIFNLRASTDLFSKQCWKGIVHILLMVHKLELISTIWSKCIHRWTRVFYKSWARFQSIMLSYGTFAYVIFSDFIENNTDALKILSGSWIKLSIGSSLLCGVDAFDKPINGNRNNWIKIESERFWCCTSELHSAIKLNLCFDMWSLSQ